MTKIEQDLPILNVLLEAIYLDPHCFLLFLGFQIPFISLHRMKRRVQITSVWKFTGLCFKKEPQRMPDQIE